MNLGKRKLRLIEEMLKVTDDSVLTELESIITKSNVKKGVKQSFKDFEGIWTKEEADKFERNIR